MPAFRVMRGMHSEGTVPGTDRTLPNGQVKAGVPREYYTGDVVHSKSDLSKHNRPGAEKFRRVPDSTPDKYDEKGATRKALKVDTAADLKKLTADQLKGIAEAEGIDLGDLDSKDEIIGWILTSRGKE